MRGPTTSCVPNLDAELKSKRNALFGGLQEGLRPLTPYRWDLSDGQLLEIPVTTLPVLKMPIHFSYLHWLASFSEPLARALFRRGAARLRRRRRRSLAAAASARLPREG